MAEPAQFDTESIVDYWLVEAVEAFQVAEHLVEQRDYSYALFFGHLAVEKTLKALYALRRHEHAPLLHNLVRLARAAGIELDQQQTKALVTITAFNIEARYPDLKRSFRAKCTPEFTKRQMKTIEETIRWLKSMLS